MSRAIVVVNAGSWSIKFKPFRIVGDDSESVLGGAVEGIGSKPRLRARDHDGKVLVERTFAVAEISSTAQAQHVVADWLIAQVKDYEIVGVGHRVVHGGPDYWQPVVVDDRVLAKLETLDSRAPLHLPANLDPIPALRQPHP